MRATAFHQIGGYRTGLNVSEDFDLYTRLSERCELGNLDEVLIAYRIHSVARGRARREAEMAPQHPPEGYDFGDPASPTEITAALAFEASIKACVEEVWLP